MSAGVWSLNSHSEPFLEEMKLRVIARFLVRIATDNLALYEHHTEVTFHTLHPRAVLFRLR